MRERAQEPGTMTTANPSSCPKCGTLIPEGAPQGLCPKCVLLGVATATQSVASPSKNTPPPSVEEIAAHFPELEVLEMIGVGGMGAVYKARQPKLDRFVALKILSRDLAGDPSFAERFDREARVLARLKHPNIVTVFDSGMAGPFAYLMMEFVDGVNLRQAMRAGRFTPPEALTLVQDICSALKFAHEKGILHRDIKPENILIDSSGQVKIADFGIAKLTGEDGKDLLTLTQRGFVLGSPHYMAPEQLESPGDVDQRADIYSLGVVLYELLTGELPIGRFAPPSKKSDVDARIDEIVMRTLERERELRFQTVGEVKTQMQAATEAKAAGAEDSRDRPTVVPSGKTARFATASAVCTALSYPLGLLFKFTMFLAFDDSPSSTHEGPPSSITQFLIPLLALTFFVGTGLLGFGFGVSALREIRASTGQKKGLNRAMFGALAWGVVAVFGLTGFLIYVLFSLVGSTNDGLFALIWIPAALTASAFLIRRVDGWVKGGTAKQDQRGTGQTIESPAAVSEAAFITEQILGLSKVTFWIAMIFLVMMVINVGPAFFGSSDNLLIAADYLPFLGGAAVFMSSISAVLRAIHKTRTQGSPCDPKGAQAAPAPIQRNQRTARFSLASAILAGCSLIFAALFIWLWSITLAKSFEADGFAGVVKGSEVASNGLVPVILSLLAALGTGVMGLILGCVALRKIRKSSGDLGGFGLAAFATVTWPLLIASSLASPIDEMLTHGDEVDSINIRLLVLFILIPFVLSANFLVRGLGRWAKGELVPGESRRHPGFALSASMAAAILLLGPALLTKFAIGISAAFEGDRKEVMALIREEEANIDRMIAESDRAEDVLWRLGKPEIAWNITVGSGMKAKLQLLLKEENGSTREFILGDCATQLNGSPGHGRLELGTVLATGTELASAKHAMIASFQSGRHSNLIRSSEDLRGFHFVDSLKGELELDAVGTRTIPLATRFADGKELATGTLSLEAVVTLKSDDDK